MKIPFTTIKQKLFQENWSSALNIQLIELSSSSENDSIIQKGEIIFGKNPTVALPEVSKLWWAKEKKTKGNTVSWGKKYSITGTMDSLWTPGNIMPFDVLYYEAIDLSFSQKKMSYLEILSMQCKKTIRVEDNKKRMSIASYINLYS